MPLRGRVIALALALLLGIAPAAPAVEEPANSPDDQFIGQMLKYIACAGAAVMLRILPGHPFPLTFVCIDPTPVGDDTAPAGGR